MEKLNPLRLRKLEGVLHVKAARSPAARRSPTAARQRKSSSSRNHRCLRKRLHILPQTRARFCYKAMCAPILRGTSVWLHQKAPLCTIFRLECGSGKACQITCSHLTCGNTKKRLRNDRDAVSQSCTTHVFGADPIRICGKVFISEK